MLKTAKILALASFTALLMGGVSQAATVRVATPSASENAAFQELAKTWEEKTGNTVEFVEVTSGSSDVFTQYRTWLSAQNSEIDVYRLDNPWVGQFANHLVNLTGKADVEGVLPNVIGPFTTVDGKLIGLPYIVGTPLLYYRADLLEKYNKPVPQTWDELTETAQFIQDEERKAGNSEIWGFVFQGNAYEGLTANALEWIASYGGGRIVEPDGTVSVNNDKAIAAINRAATWPGTISPPGVISYQENDVRGLFQTGNAVFIRHWPAVWALFKNEEGSAVKDTVAVAPLPHGPEGQSVAAQGGWGWGVSKYSTNQEAAIDLAVFLSSEEAQRVLVAKHSLPPTYLELYDDAELAAAYPLLPALKEVAQNVLSRPSGPTGEHYPEVSTEFWTAVHSVLEGSRTAEEALPELESTLNRIKGSGW